MNKSLSKIATIAAQKTFLPLFSKNGRMLRRSSLSWFSFPKDVFTANSRDFSVSVSNTQIAKREVSVSRDSTVKVEDVAEAVPLNANCAACVASEVKLSNCWSCGALRDHAHHLFCGDCGSIQPPINCSFFELFELNPPDFEIDVKNIEHKYKNLMRKLHPDKYMQQCARQRDFSSAQSSALNVAYCTLKCPYNRAVYMLGELGCSFEETDKKSTSTSDMEYMMEIMELCEKIEDAHGDQSRLNQLKRSEFHPRLTSALHDATEAFRVKNTDAARAATARLLYLKRVSELLGEELQVQ